LILGNFSTGASTWVLVPYKPRRNRLQGNRLSFEVGKEAGKRQEVRRASIIIGLYVCQCGG
jgi:hypothetical protein